MAIDQTATIINPQASTNLPGLFDGMMAPTTPADATPAPITNTEVPVPPEAIETPTPTDGPPEGTQVAGIGGIGSKLLKEILGKTGMPPQMGSKTKMPSVGDVIKDGDPAGLMNNHVIVREATTAEVDEFNSLIGKTEGAPSPTSAQKAQGIPVAEFNLNNITGPDELKATIDSISEMWKTQAHKAGRGKMSQKETMKLATDMGFDKTVERLLRRKAGDALNAEQITASLQAIATSGMELNRLAKIASTSVDSRDLLKFRQHLSFHSALQIQMKGAQIEAGRALGAFKIPHGVGPDVDVKAIQDLMTEFGGEKSVRDMAKSYLDLPSMAQRNKFTYGAWDKVKGTWFEVWINGLLSSPGTHVVNMTGNTIFQLIQIPEKFGAGLIGLARESFGSKADRVYLGETTADLFGAIQGFGDGLRTFAIAMKTGQPVRDVASKIEGAQRKMITGDNLLPDSLSGTQSGEILSKGIDYMGTVIGLPGRALMSEDEFFKAVAYRRSLNSLAYRKATKMRRDGATQDQIDDAMEDIFAGRDKDIVAQSEEFAQYATFTNPVTGATGQLGVVLQSTVLGRMMVPFYRTPVNIFKAGAERSPYGFVRAIANAKDPILRDTLIARAAMGTSVMAWAGSSYAEGKLTGSGPSNATLRKQMESLGWKRWSMVSVKEGVETPRWLQVGHQMILHPDDVEYVSYERMEPVSLILAIAADVTERFRWPTATQEEGEHIVMSAMGTVFDYMKEQTFMKGVANIADVMSMRSGGARQQGVSRVIQSLVGSQIPYSSLLANIERLRDPKMSSIISDRNEAPGLRDLYAGLKKMEDRTPFGEQKGPLLRDRFGNPRISKNASIRETLLPPFIADIFGDDIKKIEADPVMVAVVSAGVPLQMPNRKIKGVPLTAEEYDVLVKLSANLPGKDPRGKPYPSFYTELKEIVNSKSFKNGNKADQQTLIKSVDSDYKADALDLILYSEDPKYAISFADLREKVAHQQKIIDSVGRQIQ